jgi:S1-C subfamily serine protease
MRWRIGFVAALAGLVVGKAALAAGPFGTIHVGHWQGGAYTNDSTGAFSHCAAAAGYLSGISLFIGQNANHVWLMGFSEPSWELAPGQSYPIELTFDGRTQFHIFGTASNTKLISAILPTAAAKAFGVSRLMVATGSERTVQFELTATEKLLPMIVNCVDRMKTQGIAGAGDFSISPPHPPVAVAAAKSEAVPATSPGAPQKLTSVTGTGFLISPSGHVVTNNHVIKDCVGEIHGNLVGQPATTLRVVSIDETNDLALLQAAGTYKDVASIRGTAIHSGDAVIVIGFPFHGLLTSDFSVTTGIISSLAGLSNDTRYLQISAPVQPGNSGGPLLDTSGAIVGVVSEKLNALTVAKATGDLPENINFAIKTGALRDFLDNSVVPYRTSTPAGDLKISQIASDARAYTMLIFCKAQETTSEKK